MKTLIKQGETIEFFTSCNSDREKLRGMVEYRDQLGLVAVVNGIVYELRKVINVTVTGTMQPYKYLIRQINKT